MLSGSSLIRSVEPSEDPIMLADMKDHLRVTDSIEDKYIQSLITAATRHIEGVTNRALVSQTWIYTIDAWPIKALEIPKYPLQSVTSINYTDKDSVVTPVTSTVYDVDTASRPGLIRLAYEQEWPNAILYPYQAIAITYVAGYADITGVPLELIQALRFLVSHWYEMREPVIASGAVPQNVPVTFNAILDSSKVHYA